MNYITDCNCERGRNTETSKKKRAIPANYDNELENEPDGYNCQQELSQSLIDDMLVNAMKSPSPDKTTAGAGGSDCCITVARIMC